MIVVPNFPMFHRNVLPVITEVNKWAGWQRGREWDYLKQDHEIHYKNGCIDYVYTAEADILGATMARGWIDEAAYCPYQAFLDTMARIRHPDYPNQLQITTTGGGRGNWVTQVFYRKELTEDDFEQSEVDFAELDGRGGRYVHFVAESKDNPHGGKRFYDKMVRLYGGENSPMTRRKLRGDPLIGVEGLVFPQWDRDLYVVPESEWPSRPVEIVCGVDFGGAEASSMHPVGVDGRGRYYVMDEFYRKRMDPQGLAEAAVDLKKRYPVRYFPSDHAPEWMRAFRAKGLPILRADKRMADGGDALSSGLELFNAVLNKRDAEGRPMFMVSPKCRNWIREIEGFTWKKNRDMVQVTPVDRDNHAMDETRYALKLIYKMGWDPDLRIPRRTAGGLIRTERAA